MEYSLFSKLRRSAFTVIVGNDAGAIPNLKVSTVCESGLVSRTLL